MCHRRFFCLMLMCVVSLSFCLAGCTVSTAAPTPPAEAVAEVVTAVASRVPATATVLPVVPTATAVPTLTPTPTVTPTIAPTATETPVLIPTPPGGEVTDQVLWLFETNNGCQLPCWWGITPGKTTWETAAQFFNTFAPHILAASGSEITNYSPVIPLPTEVYAEVIEVGNDYSRNMYPIFSVRDGIVVRITTDVSMGVTPPGYLIPYVLSTFLTNYGKPSEIWLFTYSSPFEEGDLPFVVVLFYSDLGIAALYSDNGILQGSVVHGCPQQNPVSILSLHSPFLGLTFEQLTDDSSAFNRDFLPLEETTEMDVVTFYETFKNPDNTICLDTPADLWR